MRTNWRMLALSVVLFANFGCGKNAGDTEGIDQGRQGRRPAPLRPNPIQDAVFSPDGSMLLAIDSKSMVYLWDVANRDKVWSGEVKGAECAHYFADGNRVAIGTRNGSAIIWDARRRKSLVEAKGDHEKVAATGIVRRILVTPDQRRVIWVPENSGSDDTGVFVWNVNKRAVEDPILVKGMPMTCPLCLALSPDQKKLLMIMKAEQGKEQAFFGEVELASGKAFVGAPLPYTAQARFFPDGQRFAALVSAGVAAELRVYSVHDLRGNFVIAPSDQAGFPFDLSPNGKEAITLVKSQLNFLEVDPHLLRRVEMPKLNVDIRVMASSPNGKLVVLGGNQHTGNGFNDPPPVLFLLDAHSGHCTTLLSGE